MEQARWECLQNPLVKQKSILDFNREYCRTSKEGDVGISISSTLKSLCMPSLLLNKCSFRGSLLSDVKSSYSRRNYSRKRVIRSVECNTVLTISYMYPNRFNTKDITLNVPLLFFGPLFFKENIFFVFLFLVFKFLVMPNRKFAKLFSVFYSSFFSRKNP